MLCEAGYLSGASSLPDSVDSHADSHWSLYGLHVLVYGDEHAGVDRQGQVVKEVVVFAGDEVAHVSAAVNSSEEAGQRNIREEELIGVERV